jgi:hypothetical protein
MTETKGGELNRMELLALRGLRLPRTALQRMKEVGVYCDPAVSIEYQRSSGTYVLRGVESGGAVPDLGAYCSYVDCDGKMLPLLQKAEGIGRNGLHGVVVAPQMVRIQAFRHERNYQLLITEHRLETMPEGRRSRLRNTVLFYGLNGSTSADWAAGKNDDGVLPVFYTRSADIRLIPEKFARAAGMIFSATRCLGCNHVHLLVARGEHAANQPESVERLRP